MNGPWKPVDLQRLAPRLSIVVDSTGPGAQSPRDPCDVEPEPPTAPDLVPVRGSDLTELIGALSELELTVATIRDSARDQSRTPRQIQGALDELFSIVSELYAWSLHELPVDRGG